MLNLIDSLKLLFQTTTDRSLTVSSIIFCCSLLIMSVANAQDTTYEVPLSSNSAASNIPNISDADMERCVEIYNEAKRLKEELDNAQVNLSLPASVDAYNSKASLYSQMSGHFNSNCAGKQSESADRVTKKLNQLNN